MADARSYILDASTLIFLITPRSSARAQACLHWFSTRRADSGRFYVPALAYHEAMRGALYATKRHGDRKQVRALKDLVGLGGVRLLDISNPVLDRASKLWAEARLKGKLPDDARLPADIVIAAEALALGRPNGGKVVVTENVGHIGRFIAAAPFDAVPV